MFHSHFSFESDQKNTTSNTQRPLKIKLKAKGGYKFVRLCTTIFEQIPLFYFHRNRQTLSQSPSFRYFTSNWLHAPKKIVNVSIDLLWSTSCTVIRKVLILNVKLIHSGRSFEASSHWSCSELITFVAHSQTNNGLRKCTPASYRMEGCITPPWLILLKALTLSEDRPRFGFLTSRQENTWKWNFRYVEMSA